MARIPKKPCNSTDKDFTVCMFWCLFCWLTICLELYAAQGVPRAVRTQEKPPHKLVYPLHVIASIAALYAVGYGVHNMCASIWPGTWSRMPKKCRCAWVVVPYPYASNLCLAVPLPLRHMLDPVLLETPR